eukprot:5841253-Amphidinium_carterae.1
MFGRGSFEWFPWSSLFPFRVGSSWSACCRCFGSNTLQHLSALRLPRLTILHFDRSPIWHGWRGMREALTGPAKSEAQELRSVKPAYLSAPIWPSSKCCHGSSSGRR